MQLAAAPRALKEIPSGVDWALLSQVVYGGDDRGGIVKSTIIQIESLHITVGNLNWYITHWTIRMSISLMSSNVAIIVSNIDEARLHSMVLMERCVIAYNIAGIGYNGPALNITRPA